MNITTDKEVRVALFVSPKIRDMVNEIAKANSRGQRQQIEYMVKKEFSNLKR